MIRQGNKLVATTYSLTLGTFLMLAFFSLFGFALVAFWIATLLPAYASPGEPFGAWKAGLVGLAWLAVCALGLGTRSTITIDPDRRVIELLITRFGRGKPKTIPFADITRVGVRRSVMGRRHLYTRGIRRYVAILETRGQLFEGQALVLATGTVETAREQGKAAAEALGLECVDMTSDEASVG